MQSSKADQLVQDYLRRVKLALTNISASRRDDIMEGLIQHITEARSRFSTDDEAEVRTLLDHLGSPDEIAEAAGVHRRPSKMDLWVPWLLLLGAFVFWLGWIAGVVMLWSSRTWRLKDKLLGTLIWPGGLLFPVIIGAMPIVSSSSSCQGNSSSVHCSSPPGVLPKPFGIIIGVVALLAPILTAIHLNRVRRRQDAV